MNWHYFHLTCAVFAATYAVWNVSQLSGRALVFGAIVHLSVILLSGLSRNVTGDISPIIYYCVIDIIAVVMFFIVATASKAVWSAGCVIAYSVMLSLHLAFFLAGQVSEAFYLNALGFLTFVAALLIIIGIAAGRHEFGREWDRFWNSRFRGWSWSGFVTPRMADYSRASQ